MRVLIAHSYYSTGPASGENRVVEDEEKLLKDAGHDVVAWTPQPSAEDLSGFGLVRTGFRSIWSKRATKGLMELISDLRPDVVHFHNLFPELSPKALAVAATRSAVVMTLHNYRMMCLSADFFRDGKICELCAGRSPIMGVVHRCYRGSSLGSASLAASLALHRKLGTFDAVHRFLAVSNFVKAKHVQAGWQSDRIVVKPNFSWPIAKQTAADSYFLYLGRLSAEKGLGDLLEYWGNTGRRLVVAGDGPEMKSWSEKSSGDVEFVGHVDPDKARALLASASAVLIPSRVYEGAPRAAVEGFAAGIPVIGTALGGISELITHQENGLLLSPNDPKSWAEMIKELEPSDLARLGKAGHLAWERLYSPAVALGKLEAIYEDAIRTSRN